MPDIRGYYSLIQFCPDLSRMETANLGVALYCPDGGFLDARVRSSNDGARRLIRGKRLDMGRLNAAKAAIKARLVNEGKWFSSPEDFRRFAASCANDLLMTEPRPLKTADPAVELETLFTDLVGARRSPGGGVSPESSAG